MDLALSLRDRFPRLDGLLAAGLLDERRCRGVHDMTAALSDADARIVDQMLEEDAADLRYSQLLKRATKLALMLDPDSVRERKERAAKKKARVETFPERSGNSAFAGRELPAEAALASQAYIRDLARFLHRGGVQGSLRDIEVMCFLDLTQGRDPRRRIPGDSGGSPRPSGPTRPGRPGGRAPFPANINLLVPVGTGYGWSAMPGEADGEVIDPQTLRGLIQAASRHPRTRWCVTLVDSEDRTAVAHGCGRGRHEWDPPPDAGDARVADGTAQVRDGTPSTDQLDRLAEFLARLKITYEPIAKGAGDHQHWEQQYRPSRRLQHLIRARWSKSGRASSPGRPRPAAATPQGPRGTTSNRLVD